MPNKKSTLQPSTSNLQPVAGYRDRVSEQYRAVCEKTGEFFREVVKFGALLNEVESAIGCEAKRAGSGLKGWLAENCPDVNYATAMNYKGMAEKCAKMIGGGTQALACLQDQSEVRLSGGDVIEVKAEVIEAREDLFSKADSIRKLEQMWFQFCGAQKGTPGRKPGAVVEYKKKSSLECAVAAVWPVVQHLLKHRGEMFTAYRLLPDDKLAEMKSTLEEHLSAIADELKNRK